MRRILLAGGVVWLASAAAASAATTCYPDLLGELCVDKTIENPASIYTQYGYVEIRARPPASVTRDLRRRLERSPMASIRRLFRREMRAGVVVVKLTLVDGQQEREIGLIPVASFTADDTNGVRVTNTSLTTAGGEYFRVSPYFKLDQNRFSIKATTSIRTTTKTDSRIAQFVGGAIRVAAPFLNAPGWLLTAATDTAIRAKVDEVEDQLFGQDDAVENGQAMLLAFTSVNTLNYQYGFEANGTAPTGLVSVRLRSTSSIFAPTDAKLPNGLPNYQVAVAYQSRANDILGYQIREGRTMRDEFTDVVGATTWKSFAESGTTADAFDAVCSGIKQASNHTKLGLTSNDSYVLYWAAFSTSQNAQRADLRTRNCLLPDVSSQSSGFGEYQLPVPAIFPAPGPGPTTDTTPPPSAAIDPSVLKAFMEEQFFTAISQPPPSGSQPIKRNLLNGVFAASVKASSEIQDVDELLSFSGTALEQREIVVAMVPLQLTGGCYYRLPDNKVRFVARRIDGSGRASGVLWHVTLTLASREPKPTAASTFVSEILVRTPTAEDFTDIKRYLPNTTRCHTAARAPAG